MRSTKCCRKKNARLASLRSAFIPLVVLALLAGRAHPQGTTLRSQSNIVLIPALVKDAQGGIVYGLAAKDFVIEDDGVEQSVRLDEAPEGQAISLVLAIQRGGRASYEFPRMQGLKSMLDPLFALGMARVAVVGFDSRVDLIQRFTEDESLIDADLTNLQPGDSKASVLDAISYSVDLLKNEPPNRQRVLLLISEIRDHGSKLKIEDAVAAIGESNTLMYALSFSPALSNILDTERGTNLAEMHNGINFVDLAYRIAQAMKKNVPSTICRDDRRRIRTVRHAQEVRSTHERLHESSAQPIPAQFRTRESACRIAPDSCATEGWIPSYGVGAKQLLGRRHALGMENPDQLAVSVPASSTSLTFATNAESENGLGRNHRPGSSTP